MTIRAETQIDLTRVDDGTPGANGATFTPSVDAAGDISWTNDKGLPNPATQNIKGPAGNTPYIQGGYWYINGTSTGVKAEGEDGTTSVWYYGNKITGTSTTPTVFSGSGIATAVVGDMYLNTDNSNVYQCTLGGNASTAKWVYAGTIADGIITVKSVNGSIASFADASEYPLLDGVVTIKPMQSGGGTPSPSNIRTISGISSVSTYRGGSNPLGASSASSQTLNGVTFTSLGNGAYTISGVSTASTDFSVSVPSFTIPPSSTHTVYFNNTQASSSVAVRFMNGSTLVDSWGMTPINRVNSTYGTMGNKVCDGFVIRVASGQSVDMTIAPIFVAKDETSTHITALGRTVYGGTLDVTKGLLTVDRAYVNAKDKTWSWGGNAYVYSNFADTDMTQAAEIVTNICPFKTGGSQDGYVSWGGSPNNGNMIFRNSTVAPSLADWNTYIASNDVQIVYYLATPQTYNVSPQQIQLLQGTNNVWTDSGDVDVKYAIISASAVEALREPIDNASKVATSYITQIDDGGIKVHDAGDQTNYAKLNADGMTVYKNSTDVAKFGTTARIGSASSEHAVVGSGGMEIYGADGTTSGKITAVTTPANSTVTLASSPNAYSLVDITADVTDSNNNTYTAGKMTLQGGRTGSLFYIDLDLNSNLSNYCAFTMSGDNGMAFHTHGYSNNQAQFTIYEDSDPSSGMVWMGLGAGGTAHGVFSETNGAWIAFSDGTYNYTGDNFGPWETSTGSNGYYLGWNAHRWRGVYSYDAPNSISDRKHKDVIGNIDFAKDLIMGLKPVEYQWKDSDHKRTHMGLIAQDSAELAKELGKDLSFYEAQYIDGSDYHGEETDDANLNWGMMYTELIAPLIKVVQEQQHEIDELKERIDALERK